MTLVDEMSSLSICVLDQAIQCFHTKLEFYRMTGIGHGYEFLQYIFVTKNVKKTYHDNNTYNVAVYLYVKMYLNNGHV